MGESEGKAEQITSTKNEYNNSEIPKEKMKTTNRNGKLVKQLSKIFANGMLKVENVGSAVSRRRRNHTPEQRKITIIKIIPRRNGESRIIWKNEKIHLEKKWIRNRKMEPVAKESRSEEKEGKNREQKNKCLEMKKMR